MEIPSPSKPVNSFEASLMMKCYVVSAPTSAPTSNLNDKAIRAIKSTVGKDSSYRKEEMQVVDLFAPKQKNQLEFYIFDPHKYPVSSNEKELKSSRENLLKALREAGKQNSVEYRCQRTYKKQPTSIEKQEGRSFFQSDLYCLRTLVKSGNKGSEHSEYTAYSSTNGKRRLFSEPGGNKKKKRMTSSAMATSIESKCTCPALHIYSNGYCFFAMRRTTSSFHSGHKQKFSASELSMGSSKLPEFIEENRMIMSLATGSAVAQARGVRTLSAGQFNITKQAMKNAGKKDTQDLNESKFTKEYLQSIDSAEEMKELLHYHGNTVLIIKKKEAETSNSTIDDVIPTSTVKMSVSDSTSDINIEDIEKMTKELDTSDAEDLLCIGWCSPNMKKMAQAFPQSLSIDGTFKTVQVDNMTHLTVTTKNTLGKTVVVLRLFIPNESKWMFRYVLMVAIPNLLGKDICKKVRSIITDGDPQLCEIVDYAIQNLYTNAKRRRCTWHVIDRLCEQKYRTRFTIKNGVSKHFLTVFLRLLQRWLYTWYRPGGGVHSNEDYQVSKALLFAMINSKGIKAKFTEEGRAAIMEYILHVTQVDNYMLPFRFKDTFDLEVYSNSAHEATNKAIKHGDHKVLATMSFGTSISNLVQYDTQRFIEHRGEVVRSLNKSTLLGKNWDQVTMNTRKILMYFENECADSILACSFQSSKNEFLVVAPNSFYENTEVKRRRFRTRCKYIQEKTKEDEKPKADTSWKGRNKRKKVRRIRTAELIQTLLDEEAELLDPSKKSESCILIPEIATCFHVHLVKEAQTWYLTCSCKYGKRVLIPCEHEIFVYKNYLQEGRTTQNNIYVKQFNHRQCSPVHWNVYAYLMDRDGPVSDWSVQDRERYEAFVSLDPTTRLGTPIELCGSVVDEVEWSAVIDKRWDKESSCPNRSATEWDQLPSSHRVLNYDCKEVLSSLKMMKDSKSDEVNMNLFKMELSQGGEIITQHEGYDTSAEGPNFEHRLEYSDRFEFSTADNRKAELTKMFHQVLNSTNLNDSMMYKLLHSQLSNLSESARDLNEVIQGDCNEEEEHDRLTRFPHKNFGSNGRDMISRRR